MLISILQFMGVMVLVLLGFLASLKLSKASKRWWVFGYVPVLAIVSYVALSRSYRWLAFLEPFNYVLAGRFRFVALSIGAGIMFGFLLPRLNGLRVKVLIGIFMLVFCSFLSGSVFIIPEIRRAELMEDYQVEELDGVVIQSTAYTCGPAAAVTFLRQVGIDANEREIAMMAYTIPQFGTTDELLVDAINDICKDKGVSCEYLYLDNLCALKEYCPAIAVIRYTFWADHFITILEVGPSYIVVGDPANGKIQLTKEEFLEQWRGAAIVFSNKITSAIPCKKSQQ